LTVGLLTDANIHFSKQKDTRFGDIIAPISMDLMEDCHYL